MGDTDPTLNMVRFHLPPHLKMYMLDDVLFNLAQLTIVVPVNRYNIVLPIFSNIVIVLCKQKYDTEKYFKLG